MAEERLTPRDQFEAQFGQIKDEQWQWLKEFFVEHYDATAYNAKSLTDGVPPIRSLMTAAEIDIVGALGTVHTRICAMMGQNHPNDQFEVMLHTHALQNMVMSQAARRAFPDHFRQLGETQ